MVTLNPPSLRSPRVQVLTPISNHRPNKHLRAHPLYLITPHVASDHGIHLVLPKILLIFLPLLENLLGTSLAIPPRLANSLVTLFLILFLENPPSLAVRVISSRQRALWIHNTTTARSQGVDTILPITTLPPPPSPRSHILHNPLPHSPFSTRLRQVSPELSIVRGASSLLRSRLTKLALSSLVFLL